MAKRKRELSSEKIDRRLREGRGVGRGVDYKPWLKIQDVSSLGRSHRIKGIKSQRVHHFLSDLEAKVFKISDLSPLVVEIREQFPLSQQETLIIDETLGMKPPTDPKTQEVL